MRLMEELCGEAKGINYLFLFSAESEKLSLRNACLYEEQKERSTVLVRDLWGFAKIRKGLLTQSVKTYSLAYDIDTGEASLFWRMQPVRIAPNI